MGRPLKASLLLSAMFQAPASLKGVGVFFFLGSRAALFRAATFNRQQLVQKSSA
jgi:hypothetical protein